MRNTWSLPGSQRVTHCSDHTPSATARPAVRGSPPFPAACPTLLATTAPLPCRQPCSRGRGSASRAAERSRRDNGGGERGPPACSPPRPELGCWRLSGAPGLPARLLQRLGAGPLPARVLRQPLSAPHQPGGSGSSSSRAAPLHTSLMAPLGAVWENDFFPLPETDFLHFISPHRPSGSKMLTFSGGQQTQLTLIYPSNGERLYYKPLAPIPRLGPSSGPLPVPQTLT